MAAQKSSVSPDQAKVERAIAAELALKAGDYRNPLVTQYLNEMGQEIELERRRLAQELWELRNQWPHRLELRAEASRRAQIATPCPHTKSA